MNRITVFLLSIGVGYVTNHFMYATTTAQVRPPASQGTPAAAGDPNALPPAIPQVANPPVYPDPEKHEPIYWSVDDLRKIFQARSAYALAHPNAAFFSPAELPPGTPTFQADRYRTHYFGMSFRHRYGAPQPSNMTGRMSLYDDADQHQGATDFYVITGGSGFTILGGMIENREQAPMPAGFRNRANMQAILPGEFSGQPVIGGESFDTREGDWFMIPPNTPHWWQTGPGGMGYIMMKIDIGWYPHEMHF